MLYGRPAETRVVNTLSVAPPHRQDPGWACVRLAEPVHAAMGEIKAGGLVAAGFYSPAAGGSGLYLFGQMVAVVVRDLGIEKAREFIQGRHPPVDVVAANKVQAVPSCVRPADGASVILCRPHQAGDRIGDRSIAVVYEATRGSCRRHKEADNDADTCRNHLFVRPEAPDRNTHLFFL